MRVLALVTDAFGGRGGIAQYNRDLLSALVAGGRAVAVTVLPRHAADQSLPPEGIQQLSARPCRVAYAASAFWVALRVRPCIVFCGHLYMAPLAALIAWIARAKLVIQTHGIEVWERPPRLRRAAVEAADLILSVSRHTRAAVLAWADITPERAMVVPDTVGDEFTPADATALRAAWGLEGKRVLLTVGRMDARERYKGHDRVIAALIDFPQVLQDVVYVIAGEGDDRGRLEALARKGGLADRVCFVGAVSRETLIEAYRMADLFVMPSTGEGFGIAFLEAMASGTLALGLAEAGARDALADGDLGVTVTEENLSQDLVRLLSRPKPDPRVLAARVRRRFGFEPFEKLVSVLFHRVRAAT